MPGTCPTCGKNTVVESLIIRGRFLCIALRCSSGYINRPRGWYDDDDDRQFSDPPEVN